MYIFNKYDIKYDKDFKNFQNMKEKYDKKKYSTKNMIKLIWYEFEKIQKYDKKKTQKNMIKKNVWARGVGPIFTELFINNDCLGWKNGM